MLVVDDDASIRLLCRVNLELEGYRVLEAKSIAEAITKWWQQAEGSLIKPPDFPKDMQASVQAGFKLFQKDGAGCIACP